MSAPEESSESTSAAILVPAAALPATTSATGNHAGRPVLLLPFITGRSLRGPDGRGGELRSGTELNHPGAELGVRT